jgi:hypothetical protein
MSLNTQTPAAPVLVPYLDLGGGLNTRKDEHALARNELAISINCWPAYDNAISKRPGSIPLITTDGKTGNGKGTLALLACRFPSSGGQSITWLINVTIEGSVFVAPMQGATKWTKIGNVNPSGGVITAAQMFDPDRGKAGLQAVFICDGYSIPQVWNGPGNQLNNVMLGTSNQTSWLPTHNDGTPITPKFVHTLGNNSHLFYSGDPVEPSSVYVSDPFFPQRFTTAAMQVNLKVKGAYQPAIIGNNDGVEGGPITGLETLGSTMVVFKESAIYNMVMTTLLGEVPAWQVVQVSNSIGNLSPRSLARFDTFVAFLGIDGVYATDGNTAWQISGDVPTFFDSSLNGQQAQIINRQTAIGVRHGNRYELFFQGASFPNTTGMWFDFTRQTSSGNPAAGQIEGMNVGGAVALRGPLDDGNVAWGNAAKDMIGKFGVSGAGDFGQSILSMFSGKADLFDDVMGPEAIIGQKQAQDAYVLIELQSASPPATNLDFAGTILVDNQDSLQRVIPQIIAQSGFGPNTWGVGQWGTMVWGNPVGIYNFAIVKIPLQNAAKGHLLQVALAENSVVPWVIIGYVVYANLQPVGY